MQENKLLAEIKARDKQLDDMILIFDDLKTKIETLENSNKELEGRIKFKTDELEVKSGKLEYILEEKEALFNKLQLALSENKDLVKLNHSDKKKQKKGLVSSIFGFLRNDNYDTIDITAGKVKKNADYNDSKKMLYDFDNSQSYITNNPDFDVVNLDQIDIGFHEQNPDEYAQEEYQKENTNYSKEDINEEIEDVKMMTEEVQINENENETQKEKEHENGDNEDNYDDMLNMIRENLNIVPE